MLLRRGVRLTHFKQRGGLFLDRDGVVNIDDGYVHDPDDIEFVPGIFELGRSAMRLNLPIMIVTNQSGVARRLYTQTQFWSLMDWMAGRFAAQGVQIAHVEHCPWYPVLPEMPADIDPAWVRDSWWRKPGAGMLRRAAQRVGVDPAECVIIGDRPGDIQAGRDVGVRAAIQFDHQAPHPGDHGADYTCTNHTDVIKILERLFG